MHVNGVGIAYEDHGEGAPFVLVHGWTGSGRDWTALARRLTAGGRRVIAPHLRGHGDSTSTGDPASYTFDHLVADLEGLLDTLGLERVDLLGHSMGGLVAMQYAVRHPERVRSLIPMDTGAVPTPGAGAWMQQLIELVTEHGLAAYQAAAADAAFPGGQPADGFAAFTYALERLDPVAFVRFAEQLTTYPSFLHTLSGLTMPATVLVGVDDTSLRDAADGLTATIPGAVLEVVPGAAHWPHVENPDGWLAALDRHFARLER